MSQDLWAMRKNKMRISWVWKMRNDHYGVRKKARKHGKWNLKQDLAAWKFGTQNLVATCTMTLRTNLEYFLKSSLNILYIISKLGKPRVQVLNAVQIRAEMNKLWSFEDNCAKLKGHFEMISKFKIQFEMTPNSISPTATLMFRLLYLDNCIRGTPSAKWAPQD